jgi:4-amino-4-deoxy-L-arabinose transferase-like glycosyltransferase
LASSRKKKKKKAPSVKKQHVAPVEPEAARSLVPGPRAIAAVLIGITCLVLYTITLAPDVLAHDSGEWQAAAATLGISHSPGSPAYLILGYLFTLVPIGTEAARVSFLSAVVGAIGVSSLFVFMMMLFDRWLPALVSAASLALAGLWWSHASVATPYNAVPTIIVISLILLLLWRRNGDTRLIYGGALLVGFGLAYHPSLLYFLPALVGGVIYLGPWKKLLALKPVLLTLAFLAAGLSLYAYLPLRSAAEPEVMYTRIDSVGTFYDYVSANEARQTGHGAFSFPEWDEFQDQFSRVVRDGYYPSYAFLVFGPAIILFHPVAWRAIGDRRRVLIYLLAAIISHMVIVLALTSIYAQYYMPLILYFSIWAGFSVFLFMAAADSLEIGKLKWLPVAILAVIYFGFLGLGIDRVWTFVDHSDDVAMRRYVDSVFSSAVPGATVMANWESYTGLQYAMVVDEERRDLELQAAPQQNWAELLPGLRAQGLPQILLSHTAPFDDADAGDVLRRLAQFQLSIKGRTYQDRSHGEPYPATVQLFELALAPGPRGTLE